MGRGGRLSSSSATLRHSPSYEADGYCPVRFALPLGVVGDPTLPKVFLFGMAAVGTAPWYGVFPRQVSCDIPISAVLQDAEASNARIRASLRPSKDDAFLLEQSLKRCATPSCCAWPRANLSGSSRGAAANSASSTMGLAEARSVDAVEGGGEDWPDGQAASLCCVVAWWHAEWGEPAFQLYTGLLFGLPLAVTSFNRYSRAVEALSRRLLAILVSLYFDDSRLTDWASSKCSAQEAFAGLNDCLGSPFAEAKRQRMSCQPLARSWAWILISAIACRLGWPSSLFANV
eukprot:s5591_g4.t1